MIRCPANCRLVRPADLVGAGTDGSGAGDVPGALVGGGAVDVDGDATRPPPNPPGADQIERAASGADGPGVGTCEDWQATMARPSAPAAITLRTFAVGYMTTSA
ncbi:hypothetical protein GCM10027452_00200 [Micromonospora halotolerans]